MDVKEKQCSSPQTAHVEHPEQAPERELTVKYCSQKELTFMPPGFTNCGVSYTPACKGTMETHENKQLYEYLYPVHRRGERYYVTRRAMPNKLQSFVRPAMKVAPMAKLRISVPAGHGCYKCRCLWCCNHAFPKHYEALSIMQRIDQPNQQGQTTKAMEISVSPGTISEEVFEYLTLSHVIFSRRHARCLLALRLPCVECYRQRRIDRLALTAMGEIGAGVERDYYDFFLTLGREEMAKRFTERQRAFSWLNFTWKRVNNSPDSHLGGHRDASGYVNQGIKQAWAARKHYRTPRYWSCPLVDIPRHKISCGRSVCPGHFYFYESWPPEETREIVEEIRSAQKETAANDAEEEKQQTVRQADPYLCARWSAEVACLDNVADKENLAVRQWASQGPYHIRKIPNRYEDSVDDDGPASWLRRRFKYIVQDFGIPDLCPNLPTYCPDPIDCCPDVCSKSE